MPEIQGLEELPGRGVKGRGDSVFYLGNARLADDIGLVVPDTDESLSVVFIAMRQETKNASDSKTVLLASLLFQDEVREETPHILQKLKKLGVKKLAMYSGDRKSVVKRQAMALGIDRYEGELLPQDKLRYLEDDIAAKGRNASVAFVGDGINGAPP